MLPFEILVHVSAPSQGRDDARYRTEARGFLNFEPVERHGLSSSSDYGRGDFEETISRIREPRAPQSPQTDIEWDKHVSCGSGIYGRRETSSFEECVLVTQEPYQKGTRDNHRTEADENAETSLSGIGDVYGASEQGGNHHARTHIPHGPQSSVEHEAEKRLSRNPKGFRKELSSHHTPLRQPVAMSGTVRKDTPGPGRGSLGSSSKTPPTLWPNHTSAFQLTSIKETPHLLIERTPALPRPRTAPIAATPSRRAYSLRRTQSDSWQTPPSTIPDSQPHEPSYKLPEITSSPCLKRPFQSSSPSPTRPSPPGTKKPRLQVPSSPPTENPAATSSPRPTAPPSSTPRPSSPPPPTHISSSPPLSTPNTNPLEIHPPRPNPSTASFSTHLTPSLTNHTAQLKNCYPKYKRTQTRPLRPLERGHWLVPLSNQDPIFQNDLWEFLNGYITSGRAGWGVWAVREDANTYNTGGQGKHIDSHQISSGKEELLKVYCWGEVVAEVWLVMYMGGKRKIKGLGSQWVDARGDAVVCMI